MAAFPAPIDPREPERLAKLSSFAILDTAAEREFDTIVSLARVLVDCPIALISLVDDRRQWFKARCGLAATETHRDDAFCAHAILLDDIMIVEDATCDPRFAGNPLVTGGPAIRFYAGVPLRPETKGHADDLPGIGTLCVIDTKPRTLTREQADALRGLADLTCSLIRARASAAEAIVASSLAKAQTTLIDRKHRQLHQAERMAGIGSWRLDITEQNVDWSDQVYAIHGLPLGEKPSLEDALSFYPEGNRAEIGRLLERCATHGEPFDFESDFNTADGRARRVRSMGEPQIVDGRRVALVGLFQDITERHAREESLRHTADTDALTGLPNRGCFETRLEETVARARSRGEPACLLLLDLDGFKGINDTFGHEAGDDVLRLMAQRLRARTFANSFVARLGGDEFVMLVTRPRDCANIEREIGELLGALRHVVERDGERRAVSATIGAALLDEAVEAPADLIRRADLALYEAKRAERGTGRVYGTSEVLRAPVTRPRAVA